MKLEEVFNKYFDKEPKPITSKIDINQKESDMNIQYLEPRANGSVPVYETEEAINSDTYRYTVPATPTQEGRRSAYVGGIDPIDNKVPLEVPKVVWEQMSSESKHQYTPPPYPTMEEEVVEEKEESTPYHGYKLNLSAETVLNFRDSTFLAVCEGDSYDIQANAEEAEKLQERYDRIRKELR